VCGVWRAACEQGETRSVARGVARLAFAVYVNEGDSKTYFGSSLRPWTTWGTLSFSDENQPSEELTTQSTFGGLKGPVRTGRSARSPPVVRTSCVVMRLGRAYYRVHAISFVE